MLTIFFAVAHNPRDMYKEPVPVLEVRDIPRLVL
jgi:hypothetical protein